ncbi:Poly(A) polymerase central domain-containing protein [Pilobolus umbonatus]|nr:Poly(A) polymerase central domain-containing protein [Pilobolus umbonatus]
MSHINKQQWGVTPPLSTDYPSELDITLTKDLINTLHDYGLFESQEEAKQRVIVLNKLNAIVKEFVYCVGKQQGLPHDLARSAGGKIFTFGSYRLGVHNTGADIDTLCVFPKHVEREHFFTIMYDMLRKRPEVTELTAVNDAYVPVIKMHFSGIPIDFVCAQLSLSTVPDDLDLSDNNLLLGLDERCIRSLNGSRVTDEILRLVPNIPVFRLALRTIKLWAKKRAIYSNIMGFLGGVAWAMLVARVCQMYPNACAASIVSRFFDIMHEWKWPQPVILKPMEEGPLAARQWNPEQFPADKSHRMPIITPAYPSMCATHNVTDSTRAIMLNEFKRSSEIADNIMTGNGNWNSLFEESDFFLMYKNYLQIITTSKSSQIHLQWSGLVESRLRQLVLKLELVDQLQLAHPYVKGIEKIHYCLSDSEVWDIAHGKSNGGNSFPVNDGLTVKEHMKMLNLTPSEPNSLEIIYTTTFYIGIKNKRTADTPAGPVKLNFVWPSKEFIKAATSWEKYDDANMSVIVKNVKGSSLPEELIGKGRSMRRYQYSNHTTPSPTFSERSSHRAYHQMN